MISSPFNSERRYIYLLYLSHLSGKSVFLVLKISQPYSQDLTLSFTHWRRDLNPKFPFFGSLCTIIRDRLFSRERFPRRTFISVIKILCFAWSASHSKAAPWFQCRGKVMEQQLPWSFRLLSPEATLSFPDSCWDLEPLQSGCKLHWVICCPQEGWWN